MEEGRRGPELSLKIKVEKNIVKLDLIPNLTHNVFGSVGSDGQLSLESWLTATG